nr:S-formylglutathione hydrolase [Nitrosovibrio sp. Nv17]
MPEPGLLSSHRLFEGSQARYRHVSVALDCAMNFSIYLPPAVARGERVPVVYWLSGLTCTDENFVLKAGAQRVAAELGLALVAPDTSPRGDGVACAPDGAFDLGLGAGFYVNATRAPWSRHYRMYDYVVEELPALIERHFPVNDRRSICGHSMGGHGALVAALRNPRRYRSVSAFSPIAHPTASPWGRKAFRHYLGEDEAAWSPYDAVLLIGAAAPEAHVPMKIDQGDADEFLTEQLRIDRLEAACRATGYPARISLQAGYDHSYFFISTFIDSHLRFHAQALA